METITQKTFYDMKNGQLTVEGLNSNFKSIILDKKMMQGLSEQDIDNMLQYQPLQNYLRENVGNDQVLVIDPINSATIKMKIAPQMSTTTMYTDMSWWEKIPNYVKWLLLIIVIILFIFLIWWAMSSTKVKKMVLSSDSTFY